MFFERFFKPKWQHPKPEVRKQALLKLSPQQPSDRDLLLKLAETDPEAEVRRTAVKRVSDLTFLRSRALTDPNAGVREVATARYRQLLAGGMEDADLQARLAELERCQDDSVLAHVARRGREVELRLAALERLKAESVLEEAALNDASPKVRQIAVGRLRGSDALERVARQSRERDRKVWRIARDALDARAQAEEAARRDSEERQRLIAALRELAEGPWREGYAAERQRLENRWQVVATPASPELAQRFAAAAARCDERIAEEAARPAPAPAPAPAQPELAARVAAIQDDPQLDRPRLLEIERELEAAQEHALDEADRHHLKLLRQYLAAGQRFLEHESELEQALAAAADADAQDEAALKRAAQRLRRAVEQVEWTLPLPMPALLERAQAELGDVASQEARAGERRAQRLAALDGIFEELEGELAGGHLREAQRLLVRAHRAVEQLPGRDRQRLERRLKGYQGRVGELRDWRRFATLPKQAELCEQMEALIDETLEPPVRAERIKALQEAWKATGGSDSPESKQLWERFRSAGDKAFESCRAYFAEQGQLRERNLAERERITEQLAAFVAQADWEKVDQQALEAIRGQARREWQAATPVERRANEPVQSRFEALMDGLTEQIRGKQERNRQRKQALLAEAQALLGSEDVRAATERVKALQAQWRDIGPAPAAAERKLWREFRASCDALFQRRQQAREQWDQQRQDILEQAQALCVRLEALAGQDGEPEGTRGALREIESAFDELGPLPRDQFRAVQQRFRQAREAVLGRLNEAARARRESARRAAEARADLCARLEAAVLAGESGRLEALRAEYQAVPAAPAPFAPPLERRWQQAVAAAEGAGFASEALAEAEQARRELCLRLEILAGVESPEADRALRMDLQVRRLAQGMTEGQRQPVQEEARELLREWLGTGPVAQAEDALDARFSAALRQLGL